MSVTLHLGNASLTTTTKFVFVNSTSSIELNAFASTNQSISKSSEDAVNNPTLFGANNLVLCVISSALICLILATIIGNVFVISAVIIERTLRTVGNYLVLSLAVTDLLVACLVMPIGAIYEITQEWRLGINLCELWTFIDVLCCTASIFHLLAIACDRFWAVTTVDYIHRRKGKHVCAGIGLIWILSALISLGPMLGWKDDEFEKRIVELKVCLVSQAMSYQIFATIFSFYAPSVLLLLLYYRIYQVAKTRILLKKQRYKYRIRRRPSFYKPRKGSEIKEPPSGLCLSSHRCSFNPNEDYFSSSVFPPPSSSGVYSSSTTDYTTTATTNTTYNSDISPNSLSPLAIVTNDQNKGVFDDSNSIKRLSFQQFLSFPNSQNQLEACEEYALSSFVPGGNDYQIHSDNMETSKLNNEEDEESSILMTLPTSNIVVYVDDFGSAVCSSCVLDESPNNQEVTEVEDETLARSKNIATFSTQEISADEKSALQQNGKEDHQNKLIPNCSKDKEMSDNVDIKDRSKSKKTCSKKKNTQPATKIHGRIKKLQFRNKITHYETSESKQESKAAKTLTIITGIFIICWLPFFLLAIVMPLCKKCVINKYFADFCLWLGWANSTLNPFLYTIFSPDFRNAFKKLIFGHKKRIKKRR